ncbi:putative amino acid transporter, transmembrane domain-containing protein [Rosa chinensis]|uniref:Putative amino acid transporter, transmembrane domain-containing protein n=1 Tax=Rosa chinensis TaxID=74649 RepID=A0A2P6QBY3_ROSCH|nr:putative amino acid transporter, transmembrane domain-containing protein [Rosa chinensis]
MFPNNKVCDVLIDIPPQGDSECFDDDGRPRRSGTLWTASAHRTTAVIDSGVLSLAWAVAQLGWIAGPVVILLFSWVTYYTSTLLSDCYRNNDPDTEKRNYTYMDAVKSNLGGAKVKICGVVQYLNLVGSAIGYTIAASISMMAIKRSNYFRKSGGKDPCHINSNPYMIAFGIMQIVLSQILNFDQLWWLSTVAAVMSFTYSTIGIGLGIAKVAEIGTIMGSMTGISIGSVTETQKMWRRFQALDLSPGNLLTDFGFYNPYWLLDIANVGIVVHIVGGYQVFCQPFFAFVEKSIVGKYQDSNFITREIWFWPLQTEPFEIVVEDFLRDCNPYDIYICSSPFFNHVLGLLGALGFWPLTVDFLIEMYIVQRRIPKWSKR